jgi:protoporphyrinogen oxidase
MLKIKKSSEFEALNFRYPKQGLGRIWSAIENKAQGQGEFLLGHTVTGLSQLGGKVTSFQCVNQGESKNFELGPDDFLVSTLPLGLTTKLMANSLTARIVETAERVVTLNDLLLVFLHVDVPSLVKESWVFVPDPDIAFHRLSEQESFDPGMTPSGSIVCCEIMSSPNRPLSGRSDAELVADALKGLNDMGYRGFKVLGQCVIRLPKSYPVFKPGFEAGLTEVLQQLDAMENFRSLGRQGAFNYIGTLDAMDIGYGFVSWYLQRDQKSWTDERARTNHYPVLD